MSDDFIEECMSTAGDGNVSKEVSVEEFEEAFCQVCINSDCVRSSHRDSNWLQRMIRQEKAVYDPDFGDPSKFQGAHQQEFDTITQPEDRIRVKPGEWESLSSEDQEFGEGEYEQPPVTTEEEEMDLEDLDEPENEEVREVSLAKPKTKRSKKEHLTKAADQLKESRNTHDRQEEEDHQPDDQDGIMIDPSEDMASETTEKKTQKKTGGDDWSVSEDDSSGLTVNIDDGDVKD